MRYLEQPEFGQLVSSLRHERGLSQVEIAGAGVSASYVSRLESGHRAPTAHAVRGLAARLGVSEDVFRARSSHVAATLQAEGMSALDDARPRLAVESLTEAAAEAEEATSEVLWQVLWHLARAHQQLGERAEQRRALERCLAAADGHGSPVLQVKALVALAACAQEAGGIEESVAFAHRALTLCDDRREVSRTDTARTLLALVAAETEAGRLGDASHHADLARLIPVEELGPLRVRVLWASATVAVRQGAGRRGLELLEEALDAAARRDDLLLWGRLRLDAVALRLRLTGEVTDQVEEWYAEARTVVELIGGRAHRAELLAVQARMALVRGDCEQAATLARQVLAEPGALDRHNRARTELLLHQAEVARGDGSAPIAELRAMAERLQADGSLDLAAEAWKALADALAAGG
ncbi:Helix-turn-helix domain-containing protein [Actinacidiphila yanglinensis]|uniref:Helix-turn-helix domain-containing protein n=1 Tax=Actinacidiphila yanglinensis TaxID=310779 RepID=A0A1H5YWQ9_9ACTN|nr:helix-turn-helix transcriptional regulator [Actinacidiphila yanglinensis]SEG28753.1 Helix-turn-helix domain-containing protein [Actinacidiphila yanglinensis]